MTVPVSQNRIVTEDLAGIARRFPRAAEFEDATVIVTGCAGFLGYYVTHFLAHLTANGVRLRSLVLLDTFLLGEPAWLSALCAVCPVASLHRFDIAQDRLEDLPAAQGATHILHMASIASPTFYREYPLVTVDANVWGLRRLLDFALTQPLRGIVFFSSSEIYGDPTPDQIPTREDYRGNVSCTGPRACYDEAKRFGETLSGIFATRYGVPVRIVRPFNNYGPGMKVEDRRVVADFARSILSGQDIEILSNGRATRTFCYVADAVLGYFLALTHSEFDVFNIGIDRPEITVRELAEIYAEAGRKVCDFQGKIVYGQSADKDYLTDNPERRCPDITRARERLGFNPEIHVAEGVERYLQFLCLENRA